jgi:salicylate hydroxylase
MPSFRVGIVGGGPAGLAAAVAIRARFGARADVRVFERSSTYNLQAGAGFGLSINGAAALAAMGLKHRVVHLGAPIERALLADGSGNRLGSTLMRPRNGTDGYPPGMPLIQGVLRGEFIQALVSSLPPDTVCFNSAPVAVDAESGTLTFDSGRSERFDAIIGADGLRSLTRSAMFGPAAPTYSGYGIFYGVCIAPDPHPLLELNMMTQAYAAGVGVIAVPTEPSTEASQGETYSEKDRARWAAADEAAAMGTTPPRNRMYYYGVTFKEPDPKLAGG